MKVEEKIKEKCAGMDNLTFEICTSIILSAPGLSLEECLDRELLCEADLTPAEIDLAKRCHRLGRANGVKNAVDNMFMTMKNKGSIDAQFYLRQCASDFVTAAAEGVGKEAFSFNMIMGEQKKPT